MERLHQAASLAITGCLSSSPIPLLLTEASLPPLRVTLTHFTLLSYEWALRLPTSFPISGLTRLGVKPRLCRSPWRAFAPFIRSCFLLLLLGRLFLLALPFLLGICLPSLWSPSFPLHAPALILLSLVHLVSFPLIIWYSGQTTLFLYVLAKVAPAYLPTAFSVALRPFFPFRQAQYVQVFPLKPAPFCKLFAGLGSTNKSAISLLFSYYLTLVLSSPPSFLSSQTLWQIWQELSSLSFCFIKLQWVPGHSFLLENNTVDELARRGALIAPSTIPCSLSPLISHTHFSWTGGILSHLNFLAHRFPQFPLRDFCSLVMFAVFSLVYAATDTAFF